jgi:hypothetical protein
MMARSYPLRSGLGNPGHGREVVDHCTGRNSDHGRDDQHRREFARVSEGVLLRCVRAQGRPADRLGASSPIYLIENAAGTAASPACGQPRSYARHWTPVHLDFITDDVDALVARAVERGARLDDPTRSHVWGRIAHLSDPFGHGVCLVQFLNGGYDEVALK